VPFLGVGRRLQDLLRPLRQQPGPGSALQRVRQLVDVKDLVLFLIRKHIFLIVCNDHPRGTKIMVTVDWWSPLKVEYVRNILNGGCTRYFVVKSDLISVYLYVCIECLLGVNYRSYGSYFILMAASALLSKCKVLKLLL